MSLDALIEHFVDQADIVHAPDRSHEWTDSELKQLREGCAALMTDLEIAVMLGKSEMAVHLKRERLQIPTVRNTPGWMSANKVRKRLGINDQRPIIGWIRKGLVMGRSLPQGSTCWMVHEISLRRFVTRPKNWPFFDINKVRDPHLRRLIDMAKERWNDEWLTTREAADLAGHGDIRKVNLFIRLGRLDAVQTYNKDGRRSVHKKPSWSYNFVRRSQVLVTRWERGHGEAASKLTENGLVWVKKALSIGWKATWIARSMKVSPQTVRNWIEKYIEEE